MNSSHSKEIRTSFKFPSRATIFIGALSFFAAIVFPKMARPAKGEGYKDLIIKAQNLVLQKERPQAVSLLAQALIIGGHTEAGVAEIKRALGSISRLFILEKAQQSYELGISLLKQDPVQASRILKSGLSLEPDNLVLLLAIGRLEIAKKDCAAAGETYLRIPSSLRADEEVALFSAQIAVCAGKPIPSVSDPARRPSGGTLSLYWSLLEIKTLAEAQNTAKIREILLALEKNPSAKRHPDIQYWQGRLSSGSQPNQEHQGLDLVQKYILRCKGLTLGQLREFLMDPYLCYRVSNFEKDLNKDSKENGGSLEK